MSFRGIFQKKIKSTPAHLKFIRKYFNL